VRRHFAGARMLAQKNLIPCHARPRPHLFSASAVFGSASARSRWRWQVHRVGQLVTTRPARPRCGKSRPPALRWAGALSGVGAGPCLNRTPLAAFVIRGRTGSGIVASRADEYRRRAQQCLEMAQTFGDRDVRRSLCYMAEVWLKLADRYQHADEVRPAMQQQQQIQPKDDD